MVRNKPRFKNCRYYLS